MGHEVYADTLLRIFPADGKEIASIPVQSTTATTAKFEYDASFIAEYVAGIEKFLERWGPCGVIFKEEPQLPNRPVRFLEVWDEPNYVAS